MLTQLFKGLNSQEIGVAVAALKSLQVNWTQLSVNDESKNILLTQINESSVNPSVKDSLNQLINNPEAFKALIELFKSLTGKDLAKLLTQEELDMIKNYYQLHKAEIPNQDYDISDLEKLLRQNGDISKMLTKKGKNKVEFTTLLLLLRDYLMNQGIVLEADTLSSLYERTEQSYEIEYDHVGFPAEGIKHSVIRKGIISDSTLGLLSPSISELNEYRALDLSVTDYEGTQQLVKFKVYNTTLEDDNLDDVIKALDTLIANEIVKPEEVKTINQSLSFGFKVPNFETLDTTVFTEHTIQHFIDDRVSHKWLFIKLKDLYEGNFTNLAQALLPMQLTTEAMLQRVSKLAQLTQKGSLTESIYDAIITKRILKGRTQYNTRAVVYVSEVITELSHLLTRVSASNRFYLNLLLLALVLAELKNTGLLAIDFDFSFVIPRPMRLDTKEIVFKTIIVSELQKALQSYAHTVSKLRFGDAIVSAYDISQEIISYRVTLGEDLVAFDVLKSLYEVIKNVAAQVCLNLPTKLLLKHPSIKSNHTLKELLAISDFLDEIFDDLNLTDLIMEQLTFVEVEEALKWFEFRLNGVKELCVPLNDIRQIISLDFKKGKGDRFSQVLVYEDQNRNHEVMVAKFSHYERKGSYAIHKTRRESLERKINSITNYVTENFTGVKYHNELSKELQIGHLPENLIVSSCDARYLLILARHLNGNKVQFGHGNFIESFTTLPNETSTVPSSNLPALVREIFVVSTDVLNIKNPYFYNRRMFLVDVLDAIWSLTQINNVSFIATGIKGTNIGLGGLKDGTRAILPLDANPKTLDFTIELPVTANNIDFSYKISTRQIFFTEIIPSSSMMLNYSVTESVTRNILLWKLVRNISERNVVLKQPGMVSSQDIPEFNFDLLAKLIGNNHELKTIAQRMLVGVENKLAVELGLPTTELDAMTSIHVGNQIVTQLMSVLFHEFGVIHKGVLNDIITEAKKSKSWFLRSLGN